MSMPAVVMMIVAMATLWGGLVAALVNLLRRPDLSATDDPGTGAGAHVESGS